MLITSFYCCNCKQRWPLFLQQK